MTCIEISNNTDVAYEASYDVGWNELFVGHLWLTFYIITKHLGLSDEITFSLPFTLIESRREKRLPTSWRFEYFSGLFNLYDYKVAFAVSALS